jgi:hypothetical protein
MKTIIIYISDISTNGPRMIGLLLQHSNSYSTNENISQQVLEVSALYC